MLLIWLGLFVEILVLIVLKPLITDFEGVAIVAVLLHSLFTMLVLFAYRNKNKVVFLGAFFVRFSFILWDLYARHIYVLPNSGADSEMFYRMAIELSRNISSVVGSNYGLYAKITGVLFYLIGPQRAMGQYINVLLGVSVVVIICKILLLLELDTRLQRIILLLAAFFPNSVVMSAIFLRETFPTFFVTTSLYFFVKWFIKRGYSNMVLAIMMLGIASMFHSGVIGILVGYVFAFLFYKKETNRFVFTGRTILSFIAILFVLIVGYMYFGDAIFYKFGHVDDISDIYSIANSRLGGSAYLASLKINNPIQLAIFGPLKGFFFLTVPLPMNWRGFMDIFTFFSDSMLYLGVLIYYWKNRRHLGKRKTLTAAIAVMILGSALIFGVGVSNAGTAVRHRQKLVPLFLVMLGVMMDGKKIVK